MALLYPIVAAQTDPKSPLDQALMDAIRLNLVQLDAQTSASQPVYEFKLNGPIAELPGGKVKRVDGALMTYAQQFTSAKVFLERLGTGGALEFDIRQVRSPKSPITGISYQYSATIQSIARAAASLSTLNITRATAQIATQTVARFKTTLNVLSILPIGGNLVQYNLSGAPDTDWVVGDSVTFGGCSNALNNGTFVIVRVNDYNSSSVIVTNASGVAQTGASGTADLCAWKYTYTNPVNAAFVAGEAVLFAGHTSAANDGVYTLWAVNTGGNTLVVKNPAGVAQGAAGGTADCQRLQYNFVGAPPSDYVVGEIVLAAGHSSGLNDGFYYIRAIGATSLTLYNASGIIQGGAAGTISNCRWVLALPTDPSSQVSATHTINVFGNDAFIPAGTYTVVQVNRSSTNNLVVHSTALAATGSPGGTLRTTRKLVKFASDQSVYYTTNSSVELEGCVDSTYNADVFSNLGYPVIEVNRGGGANYNIVIDEPSGSEQLSPAGWVKVESKSMFISHPMITVSTLASRTLAENSVYSITYDSTNFINAPVAANTMLCLYLLQVPTGDAETLVIQVN